MSTSLHIGLQDANKSTGKSTDTAKPGSSDQGAGSKQPLPQQAASAHVALPMTDAENAALPAVEGLPVTGDLVAYKLLEIGFDWTPQVACIFSIS